MSNIRELLIKYSWNENCFSHVGKEHYVTNGRGVIKGILLPNNSFTGISIAKNDQQEKSFIEGEINLKKGLKLRKSYFDANLIDYIYIATRKKQKSKQKILYYGDIFGAKNNSKSLKPNNNYFAKIKLEVIVK